MKSGFSGGFVKMSFVSAWMQQMSPLLSIDIAEVPSFAEKLS